MDIYELKEKINELSIPKDMYSIMKGGLPNERLCIVKEELWCVYYSERGRKSGLREFQTESEACEYFFEKIKRIQNQLDKQHQIAIENTKRKILF